MRIRPFGSMLSRNVQTLRCSGLILADALGTFWASPHSTLATVIWFLRKQGHVHVPNLPLPGFESTSLTPDWSKSIELSK